MSESAQPIVVAVSRSPAHGFSKFPEPSIMLVRGEGVAGDAHRGVTTQHLYLKRKNPTLPNLAQVHLFAAEMLDEIAAAGFAIAPGAIGENILTRDIDLLTLPTGTLLHIADATLEVTGLRTPCSKINGLHADLVQHLWEERNAEGQRERRAGVMSIVRSGGSIATGEMIRVELPPLPHRPLGPV